MCLQIQKSLRKCFRLSISVAFLLSASSAFASRPIRGVYEVPVGEDLKSFAEYPVKFKSDNYEASPNELNFPLPAALTGQEQMIHLSRLTETSSVWKGPLAEADCHLIGRIFTCRVVFQGLPIDPVKMEEVIRQEYPEPVVAEGKLKVAMAFGGEPIGIIKYKLRGREEK